MKTNVIISSTITLLNIFIDNKLSYLLTNQFNKLRFYNSDS